MERKLFEIHRATAITLLLRYERNPEKRTNERIAQILEEYYPMRNRVYDVKDDNVPFEGPDAINNVSEF